MTPPPNSAGHRRHRGTGKLAQALAQHLAERVRADVRQDLAVLHTFVETHGSFAEMVREQYETVGSKCIDGPANPFQ
jgi:hypothetical protein